MVINQAIIIAVYKLQLEKSFLVYKILLTLPDRLHHLFELFRHFLKVTINLAKKTKLLDGFAQAIAFTRSGRRTSER